MEKRILGVVLSIGCCRFNLCRHSFCKRRRQRQIGKANGICGGASGAVFFFSGIALVKNTQDKAT